MLEHVTVNPSMDTPSPVPSKSPHVDLWIRCYRGQIGKVHVKNENEN